MGARFIMPIIGRDGEAVEITQEEFDATWHNSAPISEHMRDERNLLIAETDWWATSDRTMTAEQTAYRQALRDIPDQAGFPEDITWPTKPE